MKILIIILLLSFTASGQHYFVIPTMNNPENKVRMVSKRFYQLSRPVRLSDTTEFLFTYIKHPFNDSIAIEMDTTYVLPKGEISGTEISNWINETYTSLTTTQRNNLTNYINNNQMLRISGLIINSRLKLWKNIDMKTRGWFDNQLTN